MPLPLITLAIPLLHSSGGWIAYAGGAYVSGTLSSSWITTFVLGNMGLLSKLGFVSAATSSIVGAIALKGGASLGGIMTTVGLGSFAKSWGLAPATFLGLTAPAWGVVVSGVGFLSASAFAFYMKKELGILNEERRKGGLEDISIRSLIKEIKAFEADSIKLLCDQLSKQNLDISFDRKGGVLIYKGEKFSLSSIRYEIDEDGSEWINLYRKRCWLYNLVIAKLQVKRSDH